MSSNVLATTGGLFQDPSVSTASSVLPRFQPGFRAEKKVWAVTGVKEVVVGHFTPVLFPGGLIVLELIDDLNVLGSSAVTRTLSVDTLEHRSHEHRDTCVATHDYQAWRFSME